MLCKIECSDRRIRKFYANKVTGKRAEISSKFMYNRPEVVNFAQKLQKLSNLHNKNH